MTTPDRTPELKLREEFNRWAETGRGEEMEESHLPIVEPTLALMNLQPDDRVSPLEAAAFSMTMLGSTPHGDAYTFAELESMFRNAGFARSEHTRLSPNPESVIISYP